MSNFNTFTVALAQAVSARVGKPVTPSMNARPVANSGLWAMQFTLRDSEGAEIASAEGPSMGAVCENILAIVREKFSGASASSEEIESLERQVHAAKIVVSELEAKLKAARGQDDDLASLKVPALDTTHGGRPATQIDDDLAKQVRAAYTAGLSVQQVLAKFKPVDERLTPAIISRLCAGIDRKVKRAPNAPKAPGAPEAPAVEVSAEEAAVTPAE